MQGRGVARHLERLRYLHVGRPLLVSEGDFGRGRYVNANEAWGI